MQNDQNWAFKTILDHFGEKGGKKYRMLKILCSEPFYATLMGKDGGKCEMMKIGHSELFWTTLVGKDGKSVNKF